MDHKASKGYDSAIGDKANTRLAKRLQALITDSQALAKHLGCSIQAVNQYKQGTAFPKVGNLIKIADYYNISVDYLFGITDTKTRNTDVQAVVEYTGLSEDSVKRLHELKGMGITETLGVLDFLIEDEREPMVENGRIVRSIINLLRFFLEYDGNMLPPKQVDVHGYICDYTRTDGFMSSKSILLDNRILENSVLDEIKQRLIARKGAKNNGKR